MPTRTKDRFADVSPYYGGDAVWFDNQGNGTLCTDSFAYKGKASGDEFTLTAGHCGGSTMDTNINSPREIGGLGTRYFTDGGYDVESFHCNGCQGTVWWQDSNTHDIIGTLNAGVGELVTLDGAASEEVPGNLVQKYDICVKFADDNKTTCHLSQTFQSGVTACQPGDSGGPAYQRISGTSDVYAVGVIVGEGDALGQTCYYNDIGDVLTLVNGNIVTH